MGDLSSAAIGTKIKIPEQYTSAFRVWSVTKVTDSQVACGNIKMRKIDGLVIGSGSSWGRRYASIATDDDVLKNRIRLAQIGIGRVVVTSDNLSIVEGLIKESY